MRNVITVATFMVLWIAFMAASYMVSAVLGLQHPSLPAWWLLVVDKGIPIVTLVAALAITVYSRSTPRTPLTRKR